MEKTDLTPIQQEIYKALVQLSGKQLITEANLSKKLRENNKIDGKNKAGISQNDLEAVVELLGQEGQLIFALHLNSANEFLIKKDVEAKLLNGDARKRRRSCEKSMSIFTNSDLKENKKRKDKTNRLEKVKRNQHLDLINYES